MQVETILTQNVCTSSMFHIASTFSPCHIIFLRPIQFRRSRKQLSDRVFGLPYLVQKQNSCCPVNIAHPISRVLSYFFILCVQNGLELVPLFRV